MKKFIELIQRVHQERFSVVMNKIVAEKIPVAFLSLAPIEAAVQLVNNLRAQGANVTTLITMENPTPPPHLKTGFNIIHISQASKLLLKCIFVIDYIDARVAIKNFPDCKTILINRGSTDEWYFTFMNHLTDLQEVYESLIDEHSKKTFCGYWLGKISNQLGEIIYSRNNHYMLAGFIPKAGSIVIDGGIFDGRTATLFSEMGYSVYGFEMDRKNFEKAKSLSVEKNFVVENLSLGSHKHEMRYNAVGGAGNSWRANGTDVTRVTTLDSYVRENKIPSVDFIKLDVEGAELEVLKGARTTISRWKPILAVSAYHKPDDFWVLINFIKELRPDYEFAMRQFAHTAETDSDYDKVAPYCYSLGLEPEGRNFSECVLFAR